MNYYPLSYSISPRINILELGNAVTASIIVFGPKSVISSITKLLGEYGNYCLSFVINNISFTIHLWSVFFYYSSTNLWVSVVYIKLIYPGSFIIL